MELRGPCKILISGVIGPLSLVGAHLVPHKWPLPPGIISIKAVGENLYDWTVQSRAAEHDEAAYKLQLGLLGGGFKSFLFFTPNLGEMIQFDKHIFQRGWFNHQPVSFLVQIEQLGPSLKLIEVRSRSHGWLEDWHSFPKLVHSWFSGPHLMLVSGSVLLLFWKGGGREKLRFLPLI